MLSLAGHTYFACAYWGRAQGKGGGRGKNTYGVKGQVFVRKRNAITLIRCVIPRECHMKLHNREREDGRQELTALAAER